jgi:hypothetical protein
MFAEHVDEDLAWAMLCVSVCVLIICWRRSTSAHEELSIDDIAIACCRAAVVGSVLPASVVTIVYVTVADRLPSDAELVIHFAMWSTLVSAILFMRAKSIQGLVNDADRMYMRLRAIARAHGNQPYETYIITGELLTAYPMARFKDDVLRETNPALYELDLCTGA